MIQGIIFSTIGRADERVQDQADGVDTGGRGHRAFRGQQGRRPRGPRPLDRCWRGRQVLAVRDDSAEDPRCAGRPDRGVVAVERRPIRAAATADHAAKQRDAFEEKWAWK